MYIGYGVGVSINGAVFYLVDSWRLALFLLLVLPNVASLCLGVFVLEETPYDLINFCHPE